MEDIVITSYKQQIKESELKADAVKSAGFDIVVEELENRNVKTSHLKEFFEKIVESNTIDDLNNLTMDEFNEIIKDINDQVTRSLIAKVEVADAVARKSKLVALSKSLDGKVKDDDNYVKVGSNLALEINNEGIAVGLDVCVRNYCNQKIYQANYREKMIEKQKELGIYDEEATNMNRSLINQKMDDIDFSFENKYFDPKPELMKMIFGRDVVVDSNVDFATAKDNYRNMINVRMANRQENK